MGGIDRNLRRSVGPIVSRVRRVLHPGASGLDRVIVLDSDESHHVLRVLRLRRGDRLSVFDGRGREWDATLVEEGRAGACIEIGDERSDPVEPPLRVEIFQALCRPDRMEWAIQKATEVGAAAIHPMRTAFSDGPTPSEERLERWRRVAREACKQCGRRRVPDIGPSIAIPVPASPEGLGIVLVPSRRAAPIGALLAGARPESVRLLVGPEGGLDAEELEQLERGGFRLAHLGPRVLRTETAGAVACALVLHAWGDLGR